MWYTTKKIKIKSKPFTERVGVNITNLFKGLDFHKVWIIKKSKYLDFLKENPEGVQEMCKSMEDMRKEVAERTAENTLLQTIKSLMETTKWPAERAMDALKIPDADKAKYISRL